MAKASNKIDEKKLSKGELRKLTALRKSLGDEIANEAFSKWHSQQDIKIEASDPNLALIESALNPLIKKIRIQRGSAYAIRRGRGRFIIEPIEVKA